MFAQTSFDSYSCSTVPGSCWSLAIVFSLVEMANRGIASQRTGIGNGGEESSIFKGLSNQQLIFHLWNLIRIIEGRGRGEKCIFVSFPLTVLTHMIDSVAIINVMFFIHQWIQIWGCWASSANLEYLLGSSWMLFYFHLRLPKELWKH